MSTTMTKFSDAVYHKKEMYDFDKMEFSRRELKILLLVNGSKTVADISTLLSEDYSTLMPDFARLVQLGLIQTEGGIVSAGTSDIMYNSRPGTAAEYTIARLPTSIVA